MTNKKNIILDETDFSYILELKYITNYFDEMASDFDDLGTYYRYYKYIYLEYLEIFEESPFGYITELFNDKKLYNRVFENVKNRMKKEDEENGYESISFN